MEIDFIELQHREDVLKLMEFCGLELKEAHELYTNSGYNFQAAVNQHFNPPPKIPQIPNQQIYNPNVPNINYHQQYFDEGLGDDDYKYEEYKKFMKYGKPFTAKYPVRKRQSFFQSIIPKFFKGEDEDIFKQALQKYIGKRTKLKNNIGNLSEVLQLSWKEKYPVLIIILDFLPQNMANVKKLFLDDSFIELGLNNQFEIFGFNPFTYILEEQLKSVFNPERDNNHLIIGRVSNCDEIQIVKRISIAQPLEQVKRLIKLTKSQCIQQEMEQSQITKQYQEQKRGNIYQRPRTIKENIKMREDKKIRQQQQEEFFKACQPKKQEINHKNIQPQQNVQPQHAQKKIEQKLPPKNELKHLSQQQIRKIRDQKLSKMKRYQQGINFKIRVPSGQNLIVLVAGQDTVQYLFDYIENQSQDLGFNNQINRNFDIYVGFGGSITLKGKQQSQLKTLFQDSEVLIIRQIVE